jgi:hypothetical protein
MTDCFRPLIAVVRIGDYTQGGIKMEREILEWLANGNTGVSSKAMAFAAVGIANNGSFGNCAPSDPSDFNRCLKLVHHVPEINNHFDKIAKLSDKWAILISKWKIVEKSFLDEVGFDWCKADRAPLTYKLMRDILD